MIRLPMILAIARAEIRSVRRLIRYWMFSALSIGLTVLIYFYMAGIHAFASRFSASVGATGPRYLMTSMGIYLIGIFVLGLIFLAFDVRARDVRERIAEVLDSRPISNTELLVGRSLGLVLMAWGPVFLVALLMQGFGALGLLLDWYIGEPIEPYSLVGFVFIDALTAFVLWCSILVFLAVVLRNRLLVALGALVLLGLQIWGLVRIPLYLQPAFGVVSILGTSSDLIPAVATGTGLVQKLAFWFLAAGLMVLAAALHPRPDGGSKSRRLALGSTLVALGVLIIGGIATRASAARDLQAQRLAAHETRRDEPRADIQTISGTVAIDPGRAVDFDLEIRLQAPLDLRLDTLLFTFNPGFDVEQLSIGGTDVEWTHEHGLLDIDLSSPLAPGHELLVAMKASGRPDVAFGYLDAEIDLLAITAMNAQIGILGFNNLIFSKRYVALMPGGRWLPKAGSDVPGGDPRAHPADFFEVDLEVTVPRGWRVAGPGRGQPLAPGDDGDRFRFQPGAPLAEVGLFVSRFERRATEVAGVELEILVHPKHLRNIRFFGDAAEEIENRVEEILRDAEKLGLPYPYGGLTLVETPASLRGFHGGWRMDTAQSMPGIMLLRENSFTTSRFEFAFRDPENFEDREGGIARAKVEAMERFFENDFSGGNLFLGGSRNFLLFQTGPSGEGALALGFVVDELANQLLTGRQGFFSAHIFNQESMGAAVGETITSMVSGQVDSIVEAVMRAASDRPSVWDRALSTSLADLEPADNAKESLNVLTLKCRAIARSILDGLGREKTGELLAELLSRHRGGHFTANDLQRLALELDADLEPLVGDWLNDATLPGFITSPVVVERLADDEQGNPRYQTRVHVLNDESTPGLLRMRYAAAGNEDDSFSRHLTEPVRLAGNASVEIGMLSSEPPVELWLQPYLSLNRQAVQLTIPRVDQEELVATEPFLGNRPSQWRPSEAAGIVIDDLDEGFSIESDEEENGVRLSGGLSSFFVPTADMDQGLPEFQAFGPPPKDWSRRETPSSWGKYRHTIATVRKGSGNRRAVFTADLPHSGRWRLAYYLPELTSRTSSARGPGVRINAQTGLGGSQGTYDLTLVTDGEERALEFDGAAAEVGWNSLGEFDLARGEVRVEVSNETTGRVVIADAIRWQSLSQTP